MSWYHALRDRQGRGTQLPRARSLAELHVARALHDGQFFTPDALVRVVWDLLSPVMISVFDRRLRLFDNSVGSGRLFQFADSQRHSLSGVDTDAELVAELAQVTQAAGFIRDFAAVSMAEIHPTYLGYDIGLINPPYSITLQSPHLKPYPCTRWGRFGPNTSALSHEYALHQALNACPIVAAILYRNYARTLLTDDAVCHRLVALLHFQSGAFESANAQVDVSLAVFDDGESPQRPIIEQRLVPGAPLPHLPLRLSRTDTRTCRLGLQSLEDTGPTIHLPVTGNARVRVAHDSRRLTLRFHCGLIQAKVMNAILLEPLPQTHPAHRYPPGLRYCGQLALDLEVHLLQDDPRASVEALLTLVRQNGGEPDVAPQLWRYLERRRRELERASTPFRRWVNQDDGSKALRLTVRPRRLMPLDPTRWGSPILDPAQPLELRRTTDASADAYELHFANRVYTLSADDLQERFVIGDTTEKASPTSDPHTWELQFPGKAERFPRIASAVRGQARSRGLERWLTWDYQFADLIEAAINPRGAVIAWEPGMGKARLALSLAVLFDCRHALIVLEAGLIGEFERELALLKADPASWQILRHPNQLAKLRRVNIISYERLRSPVVRGAGRRTWARRLRRRVGIVICDEADHLAHLTTAQTRAVAMLSAKRRYALTGTPMGNYPRDVLPLISWISGDGTAAQPYGYRRAYLQARLRQSASFVKRGVDEFRARFITTEWVTNQFAEQLNTGAKREIPKLRNLQRFREFHAPHLLRRQVEEPECARYLPIPVPTCQVSTLPWDDAHLAHYLTVAEEFVGWYQKYIEEARAARRAINSVQVLARIQAVVTAANQPHEATEARWLYYPITSKQRHVLDRLATLAADGHKTILYARSPGLLQRLEQQLTARGLEAVRFDGTVSPTERMRQLDLRFRFGPAPILLASFGVTQKGLNIPQADRVLFYNREWTARSETQAGRRVLRPQQTRAVHFEYTHLRGSIDEYMAQMVRFKQDAADAGLDWQRSELDYVDFVHLDTILGRFCEDLSALRGLQKDQTLREALISAKQDGDASPRISITPPSDPKRHPASETAHVSNAR